MFFESLENSKRIYINQRKELIELIGFESRNKYCILNENREQIGFAAEDGKTFAKAFGRQLFGHWRAFTLNIMDMDRNVAYQAHHPFKFFFQRIELSDSSGKFIGSIQQRFSLMTKKFDLNDAHGNTILKIDTTIFKPWTFSVTRNDFQVALILKKWSGTLKELFTDADNFTIDFKIQKLKQHEKELILVTTLLIDIVYFERKASSRSS